MVTLASHALFAWPPQAAVAKLESRLAQEKQFNRKVEINAQLRTIRSELHGLTS